MKLFMDNTDRGANHANDELVAALRQRAREIQALAHPARHHAVPNTEIEGIHTDDRRDIQPLRPHRSGPRGQ